MRLQDTSDTYGAVSIVNHWLLAAVVIGLSATGVAVGEFLEGEVRSAVVAPHKAMGVIVLALLAWMLVWRLTQPSRPGAIAGTPPAEAFARKAMHAFLVAGTVVLSLSGVLMSLFKGRPIDVFGLFTIPGQAKVDWLAGAAHEVHVIGGWLLIVAIAGHAAVALKHHLVDHDATFARMVGRGA